MSVIDRTRLQFAVRFAQMDFEALPAGDWLTLREDLDAFLLAVAPRDRIPFMPSVSNLLPLDILTHERSQGGLVIFPVGDTSFTSTPEHVIRELQEKTWVILLDVVRSRNAAYQPLGWYEVRVWLAMSRQPGTTGRGRHVVIAGGSLEDTFLFALCLLLRDEPIDRILRCSECGTLFYRVGKQVYCSRPCANRVAVRKWRATETGKRREAARQRKRYQKRIREKTGSPIVTGGRNAQTTRQP